VLKCGYEFPLHRSSLKHSNKILNLAVKKLIVLSCSPKKERAAFHIENHNLHHTNCENVAGFLEPSSSSASADLSW